MYKNEGYIGFFKGNGANAIKVVPFSALEFFTFDFIRYRILLGEPLTTRRSLIIGAIAGMVSSTFTYPLDLIRTLFTLQVNDKQYSGIFNTMRQLFKNEGVKGLYRGWTISLMGIIPYISIKMTTYNTIKHLFYGEYEKTPVLPSLVFGAIAGAVGITLPYPADVIKRRLQMKALNGMKSYDGIVDCFMRIGKEEGIQGYYRRLMACYIKVIPSTAIAFSTNSFCKKILAVKTTNFKN